MRQTSRTIRVAVAAALGLAAAGANAAPAITSILTTYSAQGTPTALTIAGSGFCSNATGVCSTSPTVAVNGSNLTVSAATAGSLTATFAVAPPDGDYTLSLTAGTLGATTFSLHVESLDKGATGATGATGGTGAAGSAGAKGATGATGPAGTAGSAGAKGATGATGAAGAAGAKGSTGVTGSTGVAGPAGPTGSQGPQGIQGAAGPQGLQGVAGTPGINGINGINGTNGINGLPGATGPVGPQGIPGVTGPVGPTGATGNGFTVTGAWSPTIAYAVNDVVTFNGSAYAAVAANSAQTPANGAFWSLLVAQGPTGATGASGGAGSVGPTGPQGSQGIPGATGPIGATGAQGPVGATGSQGVQGPPGAAGSQGIQGPTGSAGAPGNGATITTASGAACPSGGATITDGAGNSANVCGGTGSSGGQTNSFKGNWSAAFSYIPGDIVSTSVLLNGSTTICTYMALVANSGVWPGASVAMATPTTNWFAFRPECAGLSQTSSNPSTGRSYLYAHGPTAIYQFAVAGDGSLSPLSPPSVPAGIGNGRLVVDSVHKFLFATNANDGDILAYSIGPNGALTQVGGPIMTGNNTSTIFIDDAARHLYVDTYSQISHFPINADGSLGIVKTTPIPDVNSPPGNLAAIDPLERFVVSFPQNGYSGGVWTLGLSSDGSLPTLQLQTATGIIQSAAAFDSTGKYLYTSSSVGIAQWNVAPDGSLTHFGHDIVLVGGGFIYRHPTAPYLYIEGYGGGLGTFLYSFSIGADGALTQIQPSIQLCTCYDGAPLAVDPAGKFLYAALGGSGVMYQYSIGANGVLAPLSPASIPTTVSYGDVVVTSN